MSRPAAPRGHGDYGYARRENCKCDLCVRCIRVYAKRRKFEADSGNPRKVDATPARLHIEQLIEMGLSEQQIAVAAGITRSQVTRVRIGESQMLFRDTVPAVLAVTYDSARAATFSYTNPTGVRRRIEALRWMGYSRQDIAVELGVTFAAVARWTSVGHDRIRTSTVDDLDAVYQRLHMTVGPNTRERWMSYRKNYKPPMAWDPETIDDPEAIPYPTRCIVQECARPAFQMNLCRNHFKLVGVKNVAAREWRRRVERFGKRLVHTGQFDTSSDIAELRDLGMNMFEVARRTGKSMKTVERFWGRAA